MRVIEGRHPLLATVSSMGEINLYKAMLEVRDC
jgi:hypothetical protein